MNNEKKTGGPAFACAAANEHANHIEPGMSLLDYFAGLAMQSEIGLQANDKRYEEVSELSEEFDQNSYEYLASKAYQHASAMIAERERIMNETPEQP